MPALSELATAGLDDKTTRYVERMAAKNPRLVETLERAALFRVFAAPAPKRTAPNKIYFAARSDGLIKIGTSSDPARRVQALSTGAGESLALVAVVDGGRARERALHERFADTRVHGEWFSPSPELLEFIEGARR
jgi:hypothetical protein